MAVRFAMFQAGSPYGGSGWPVVENAAGTAIPTITAAAAATSHQVDRTVHSRVHSAAQDRANNRPVEMSVTG
jgi:hypothetical protein